MSDYKTIQIQHQGAVATLLLNRPERRNALTTEMLTELADALALIENDATVRAVLLTGAGQGFCSGQDLSAFGGTPSPEDIREAVIGYYKPVITGLCTLSKPVIGAINGVAAGAGASLALACDLRIMANDASLMQAFSNIGLVPDAGSTWFLVRHLGYSRAFEIAIEGERVPAQRCLELGLVNRVAPADQLLDQALQWAQHLAQRPTLAIGMTKQAMMQATISSLEEAILLEAELQMQAVVSDDHQEGVQSFLQKRAPVFRGQ